MPDPDAQVTPMRKGKFVNTVRGSGFPEISLDDLAVEFFDSFSGESGVSSGERGRSGSRKSSEGEVTHSQRRGRSVSRVCPVGNGGLRRLDADTESSRRRRSLSRQPSERGNTGNGGGSLRGDPGSNNSSRRRSVSRQPRERVIAGENSGTAIRGRAIGTDRENANSRRRRSLSVVRCRIDNSEVEKPFCIISYFLLDNLLIL